MAKRKTKKEIIDELMVLAKQQDELIKKLTCALFALQAAKNDNKA